MAKSQGFQEAFEEEGMTGDAEDALLLVTILLSGFIKEVDENWVAE